MPPTPSKSESKSEEVKRSLPVGHPAAGYVSPDPTFVQGVEIFPEEEQKARDEAKQAWEDEKKAVEDAEHEAATKEAKEAEKAAKASESASS